MPLSDRILDKYWRNVSGKNQTKLNSDICLHKEDLETADSCQLLEGVSCVAGKYFNDNCEFKLRGGGGGGGMGNRRK